MAPGSDETPDGGDPEEGKVLSPEELDIADDEHVKEIDDGRYVVSSGDPIADSGDDTPSLGTGQTESRRELAADADEAAASAPTDPEPERPEPAPQPAPEPESEADSEPELTARTVHNWLSEDLEAANSRYGFDVTAAFDGTVSQQRMVSNDVVATFESLMTWYGQQTDRNTPVEEVLGILLMEANVPIRYPPQAVKRAMQSAGLGPDDTIADLMEVVAEDDGLQL